MKIRDAEINPVLPERMQFQTHRFKTTQQAVARIGRRFHATMAQMAI
jgi:hypothetical protein